MRARRVVAGLAVALVLIPANSGLAKQARTSKQVHASARQKTSRSLPHATPASGKTSRHSAHAIPKCSGGADGERSFSGIASTYASEPKSGNGSDGQDLTAAHCTLPFGTRVQVTNVVSGSTIIVTITDRGPFVRGRVLDLSPAAAQAIGLTKGVVRIRAEVTQDFPFWELRWPEKPAT